MVVKKKSEDFWNGRWIVDEWIVDEWIVDEWIVDE